MSRTPEDAPTDPDQLIRFGSIKSVDLAAGRCVVTLDDDSVTPAIRWIETRMGKTRTWSPPSEGEQVVLLCPAGEIGAAVALRGVISDAFPAPGSSLAELIEFEDGATVSYDPEAHAMTVSLPAGAIFKVVGNMRVEGDVVCTGAVTGETDVFAAGISGKAHKHGLVKAGTDTSGAPQ